MKGKARKALVVGGGMAGLEAALKIGQAGHEVILVEKKQTWVVPLSFEQYLSEVAGSAGKAEPEAGTAEKTACGRGLYKH